MHIEYSSNIHVAYKFHYRKVSCLPEQSKTCNLSLYSLFYNIWLICIIVYRIARNGRELVSVEHFANNDCYRYYGLSQANPLIRTKPTRESYLLKVQRWAAAGTTLCMPCRRWCEATTYKSATVEQVLPCQQERGNVHDLYSVTITGWNVPRAISAVCSLFLRKEKLCYYMRTKFAEQIFAKGSNTAKFEKVSGYTVLTVSVK